MKVRPTIFLHLEPVPCLFSIRLHPDLVRPFSSFGVQFVGELQDFTFSCLVEPLCDPDTVGILLEGKRNPETRQCGKYSVKEAWVAFTRALTSRAMVLYCTFRRDRRELACETDNNMFKQLFQSDNSLGSTDILANRPLTSGRSNQTCLLSTKPAGSFMNEPGRLVGLEFHVILLPRSNAQGPCTFVQSQ